MTSQNGCLKSAREALVKQLSLEVIMLIGIVLRRRLTICMHPVLRIKHVFEEAWQRVPVKFIVCQPDKRRGVVENCELSLRRDYARTPARAAKTCFLRFWRLLHKQHLVQDCRLIKQVLQALPAELSSLVM